MAEAPVRRPRIEGARQREIFDATIELVGEIGYDRLTLDTVAARVKVSKATIYRLWGDKSALVDAAIGGQDTEEVTLPDTGTVIGDLRALTTMPGFFDPERAAVISGLTTAIHRDPAALDAVRRRLVDDGTKHVRGVLLRAAGRGELAAGVDVDLLSAVIPAMVLFQMTYRTVGSFGERLVDDIVEKIIAPALQPNQNPKEHRGPSSRR